MSDFAEMGKAHSDFPIDLNECPLAEHTFLRRIDSMAAEVDVAEFSSVGLDKMEASLWHP